MIDISDVTDTTFHTTLLITIAVYTAPCCASVVYAIAMSLCLSVCPSIYVQHSRTVSKDQIYHSNIFTIAPSFLKLISWQNSNWVTPMHFRALRGMKKSRFSTRRL